MNPTEKTKLLITGQMRSGTTLLANLLNAQESVCVWRDFLHIGRLADELGCSCLDQGLSVEQRTRVVACLESDQRELGCSTGFTIDPADFSNLIEYYVKVLDGLAGPGDRVVGHKTTEAHEVVGQLLRHVPPLKVIYMLRDPRDVVLSADKKWPWRKPAGLFEWVDAWGQSYETIAAIAAQPETGPRLCVLRYEELLLHPEETLARLACFLQLPRISLAAEMTDYGQPWQGNSSFGELKGGLDTTPVGRWRSGNPRKVRTTEICLEESMRRAGYEVSSVATSRDKNRVRAYRSLYTTARVVPCFLAHMTDYGNAIRRRLPARVKGKIAAKNE